MQSKIVVEIWPFYFWFSLVVQCIWIEIGLNSNLCQKFLHYGVKHDPLINKDVSTYSEGLELKIYNKDWENTYHSITIFVGDRIWSKDCP